MPSFSGLGPTTPQKPKGPPKKFIPFSVTDSRSIEAAFQELVEQGSALPPSVDGESPQDTRPPNVKNYTVPVNEDFLFDVDVIKREVSPVYWIGPTYEIRRGSWFFQDGSSVKPCEENLAAQLEEGYLKIHPWKQHNRSMNNASSISNDSISSADATLPKASREAKRSSSGPTNTDKPVTYRLLGSYMNNVVTYQDATTALLCADDFMSRMSSTVYQTFGGLPGTKVIRGYTEPTPRTKDDASAEDSHKDKDGDSLSLKSRSTSGTSPENEKAHEKRTTPRETFPRPNTAEGYQPGYSSIERSLLMDESEQRKESARRQEEQEMETMRETKGDEPGRKIDHLILVTHGIGQRLGLRMESISFIHDINVLRKTMKSVYSVSPNLQALNSDITSDSKNCRVQVLPVYVPA